MNILGLSALYHDSAACLVQDGIAAAAAQEERFTRKKHDSAFPTNAIRYCLDWAKLTPDDLDVVAFYDKPLTKFIRLLQTYSTIAPFGFKSFELALPQWLRRKLWVRYLIEKELRNLGRTKPIEMVFPEHHESHAASAFFPSPFDSAAIITMDGVGEWATSTIGHGRGNRFELLSQMRYPHSLGLLYSAFTYFAGFRPNSGEYKLMGLAPYGEPKWVDAIYEHLMDLRPDGSFRLDMKYFDYLGGVRMTNRAFAGLFGGPAREPESRLTQREMDLARSIQVVAEEVVLRTARHAQVLTGEKKVCLAGGVALNCVANGRLLRDGPFDDLWIQPASGDAGGAIGSALFAWHQVHDGARTVAADDGMNGSYLGPSYEPAEIQTFLDGHDYPHRRYDSGEGQPEKVAQLIANQKVVGLFMGRMEYGPRSLGHRAIVGDARSPKMQSIMNLKVKFRESFRPFAPSVLAERAADYFELSVESPYMLLVAPVRTDLRTNTTSNESEDLIERVNQIRSSVPAITHVDYSARVQTVSEARNPRYYEIIKAFESLSGEGLVINTSFNVRGEPIVCTPEDAYRCFMRTEMDALVLEDCILLKHEQPPFSDEENWKSDLQLD